MTNHAKVGGIFSIVAGGFSLLWTLALVLFIGLMWIISDPYYYDYYYEGPPGGFVTLMIVIYIIMGLIGLLLSALAVVGGIFSIKKKAWGLALAGAIAGVLVFFPCGIVAVIFIVLGKPEFDVPPAPAPAALQT